MTETLDLAESRLLAPAELVTGDLDRVFARLLAPGVDFADLYFQHSRHESWSMEDGIVKDGTHSIEQGVGVRAISGEKTGFAYSDEIRLPALLEAAGVARAIARSGRDSAGHPLSVRPTRALYPAIDPIESLDSESKVRLLREVDAYLRAKDARVRQVMVSLAAVMDTVLVARSDGTLGADVRPLVRINVQVIVEQGTRREQGYSGGGGRYAYGELIQGGRAFGFADEALRQALLNLEAVDAPAGSMPVVVGAGWPGVLLHEAVGHGLEGDLGFRIGLHPC
jgi:TldD protein